MSEFRDYRGSAELSTIGYSVQDLRKLVILRAAIALRPPA
jgi:hypothetical protein